MRLSLAAFFILIGGASQALAMSPLLKLNEPGCCETRGLNVLVFGNASDGRFSDAKIAGGVVPGVLILKPDFPENKEDWLFLRGENESVVNLGANHISLVNAVNDLLAEKP